MIETIERCAARVVSLLRERHSVNILLLPELLDERSTLVYQALGWLARGSTVRYSTQARQVYVSLADEVSEPEAAR